MKKRMKKKFKKKSTKLFSFINVPLRCVDDDDEYSCSHRGRYGRSWDLFFFTFCVFRKALSVKERNHMSMLSKYIPQISWLFLLPRHPLLLFCCCWWSVGMQHTYAAWRYLEKNTKKDYNNVDVVVAADLRSSFEVVQQHVCCLLLYMYACMCMSTQCAFVYLFLHMQQAESVALRVHFRAVRHLPPSLPPLCCTHCVVALCTFIIISDCFCCRCLGARFVVVCPFQFKCFFSSLFCFYACNSKWISFASCFLTLSLVYISLARCVSLALLHSLYSCGACWLFVNDFVVLHFWRHRPFFCPHTLAHTLLQLQLCVVCTPSVFYIWFCIPLHCYFSHLDLV